MTDTPEEKKENNAPQDKTESVDEGQADIAKTSGAELPDTPDKASDKTPDTTSDKPEDADSSDIDTSNESAAVIVASDAKEKYARENKSENEVKEKSKPPKVVGIRHRQAGKMFYFNQNNLELKIGQEIVVEAERGLALGHVVKLDIDFHQRNDNHPLKRVVRIADARDVLIKEENSARNKAAHKVCNNLIEKLKLKMKLIEVEYQHSANKATFYFGADGRVDFRELVQMLAQDLRIRVEMRQIGIRDEAKLIGGLGPCGRPTCCSQHLVTFHPVSIRMAKEQNLTLNPEKVSGLCSRLMCCLQYESPVYKEMKKGLPKIGKRVEMWKGAGRVLEINIFSKVMRLQLETREYISINIDDFKAWKEDPEGFTKIIKDREEQERMATLSHIGIADRKSGGVSKGSSKTEDKNKAGKKAGQGNRKPNRPRPGDKPKPNRPSDKQRHKKPYNKNHPQKGKSQEQQGDNKNKRDDKTEGSRPNPKRRRRSRGRNKYKDGGNKANNANATSNSSSSNKPADSSNVNRNKGEQNRRPDNKSNQSERRNSSGNKQSAKKSGEQNKPRQDRNNKGKSKRPPLPRRKLNNQQKNNNENSSNKPEQKKSDKQAKEETKKD